MKIIDILSYDYSKEYLIEILESVTTTPGIVEVSTVRIAHKINIGSDLDLLIKTYIYNYGTSPRFGWIENEGKKRAKKDLEYLINIGG